MKHVVALILLILQGAIARAADTRETVLWLVNDFAPYNILSGPSRGQGAADIRMQMVVRRLPEFRHEIVEGAAVRSNDLVKTKPNVCRANLLKNPERETFMEFSRHPLEILSNGLITTRKRAMQFQPYLNEKGELRLDDFLGAGKRVTVITDRAFGAHIDSMLKKYTGTASVVKTSPADHMSSRLLKLASQDEFDGIVGYAVELRYLARQLGLQESDFTMLPIADELPLVETYFTCSKSDFGKRVINAIDRVLDNRDVRREIDAAYRGWLADESAARYDALRKRPGECR